MDIHIFVWLDWTLVLLGLLSERRRYYFMTKPILIGINNSVQLIYKTKIYNSEYFELNWLPLRQSNAGTN